MGVTIHFEGRLRSEESFRTLVATARDYAFQHGWKCSTLDAPDVLLQRVCDERNVDVQGPVRGILLEPGPDCEPVRLDFDRDLFLQEYTKTQYAGAATHMALVGLLEQLASCFDPLDVFDEGEYWETHDQEALQAHLSACNDALEKLLAEKPEARIKVHLPKGRIADFIR